MILLFLFFCQHAFGQLKLMPDKDTVVFSLNIDTLELNRTYYFEDVLISNLDTIPNSFNHFTELLPDKSNYLIILYTEGTVNEKYSVSPFIDMLEKVKSFIIAKKMKVQKSQFIFPEYLTKWTLKNEKYNIKSGLRVQLIELEE